MTFLAGWGALTWGLWGGRASCPLGPSSEAWQGWMSRWAARGGGSSAGLLTGAPARGLSRMVGHLWWGTPSVALQAPQYPSALCVGLHTPLAVSAPVALQGSLHGGREWCHLCGSGGLCPGAHRWWGPAGTRVHDHMPLGQTPSWADTELGHDHHLSRGAGCAHSDLLESSRKPLKEDAGLAILNILKSEDLQPGGLKGPMGPTLKKQGLRSHTLVPPALPAGAWDPQEDTVDTAPAKEQGGLKSMSGLPHEERIGRGLPGGCWADGPQLHLSQ